MSHGNPPRDLQAGTTGNAKLVIKETLLSSGSEKASPWVCPYCLCDLGTDEAALSCVACEKQYPVTASGQPDFRLTHQCEFTFRYAYDPVWARFPWECVRLDWPENSSRKIEAADWEPTERAMISVVPEAEAGAQSLDLGCGNLRQRFKEPLTMLGYHHTGIDIDGTAPDALADAHLLPFRDESFDLVVTSAVFEHVKNPHLVMTEVARVIKPDALFIGSIAFNEPFHISYFHQSPLAVYELLASSGFDCRSIILTNKWNVFDAHFEMGFAGVHYPAILRQLIAGAHYQAALLPARIKSLLRRNREPLRAGRLSFARSHTASVGFIAVRKSHLHENRLVGRAIKA